MENLLQDIRICFRGLLRRPMFSIVAILTLGLGIGATTAMFGVAETVLLPNLSYQEPERLVTLWQEWPGYRGLGKYINLTDDQYRLWRDKATLFKDVAMFNASEWGFGTMTERGTPSRVSVGSATGSLAGVLGVSPHLGRWIQPDEEGLELGAAAPVAVISYELWQAAFGGDPEAIGNTIVLDSLPRTIVGVLPAGFELRWLGESPLQGNELVAKDVWVPYGQMWDCVGCGSSMYQGVGRLAEGASVIRAQAEAERILNGTAPTDKIIVRMVPRSEDEVRGLASPILLLLGGTSLLLLIACGNMATLSVGEMQGRAHEIATRAALGAGKLRIVRLVLAESVILGLLGSALGIGIAFGGVELLKALAPPIPHLDEIAIDFAHLAFAAGLGVLTGFVFGSVPSLNFARASAASSLRAASRTQTGRSSRFHSAVIAAEIALAVVLLVTGGLLTRSLSELLAVDPGFATGNLTTAHLSLPADRYDTEQKQVQFLDQVVQRLREIPGATDVTAANGLPFPGRTAGWSAWLPGKATKDDRIHTKLFHVAAGFHETMGIPLLEGRAIAESDTAESQRVALISESLARTLWPDSSPLGALMHYPWGEVTVVGVVSDVKRGVLAGELERMFYVPFAQHARGSLAFAVRTSGDPRPAIPLMREAIWDVDPDVAITQTDVMSSLVARSASDERFRTLLIGVFAITAVLLASVGIFGVTARMVGRRTRELAIRMAIGARGSELTRMVIAQNLVTGLLGTAAGLAGAMWVSRFVGRFLFGVEAMDLSTYAAVSLFVLAVSVAASYIPARRSARVDPIEVLRAE
ncbi:MAG: ABC transporter permease [bacterium]|nr:ABC transporter permease [bacterium]